MLVVKVKSISTFPLVLAAKGGSCRAHPAVIYTLAKEYTVSLLMLASGHFKLQRSVYVHGRSVHAYVCDVHENTSSMLNAVHKGFGCTASSARLMGDVSLLANFSVVQVLVATDDNEITSSARSKGGYQVPCRDLIGEILKVCNMHPPIPKISCYGCHRGDRAHLTSYNEAVD